MIIETKKIVACRELGFTLIELMITVVIVAILVAVALPSYQSQVRDTRRADATSVLLQARQQLERYYSKNYTYVGATIPTKSPVDGTAAFYNIAFPAGQPTATTFIIQAVPVQSGDTCGTLTLNQAGVKTAGASIDDCWR